MKETSLHRHENGMEREVVGSKPTLDACLTYQNKK
jgi:hypothetical protein